MLCLRSAVHIVYLATSTVNMGGDKEQALVVSNQLIQLLWSAVHLLGHSEPGQERTWLIINTKTAQEQSHTTY